MKITVFKASTAAENCFHPACCCYQNKILMTMQPIFGSDHYGPPQFAFCSEAGGAFSAPEPIPAFASRELENGFVQGVADVRPFDLGDGRVAAFGCTAIYSSHGNAGWDPALDLKKLPPDFTVAAILGKDGKWGPCQTLDVAGKTAGYRAACTQIAPAADADSWIVPFYFDNGKTCRFGNSIQPCFSAVTARYRLCGDVWRFEEAGNILSNPAGRGFCEPSMIRLPGSGYALTLRAEDGFMHTAVSADGLHWSAPKPWCWEDGSPLKTSCTQQHFLRLGGKIYLVYTRDDGANQHIMRFRAPLYLAEADPEHARLFRATEKIVFPQEVWEGVEVQYGNFHAAPASAGRAWISDSALRTDPATQERRCRVLLAEVSTEC